MGTPLNVERRIFSYDLLRVIAIAAVLMIHCSAIEIRGSYYGEPGFFTGIFFNGFSRLAVPFFVMLTGALVLRENKPFTKEKLLHNVSRLFVLFIIWSVLYAIIYEGIRPIMDGNEISSWSTWVHAIIFGHYHLWYLLMAIGLYLIMPVLKAFVSKKNAGIVQYFLILSIIFQFMIPLISFLFEVTIGEGEDVEKFMSKFKFLTVGGFIPYLLAGWYITNVGFNKKHRQMLYVAGAVSLTLSITLSYFFSTKDYHAWDVLLDNYNILTFIYSIAAFTAVFYGFKERQVPMGIRRATAHLSNLSFGVYLFHVIIINMVAEPLIHINFAPLSVMTFFVVVSVLSFAIVFIMTKVPGLKRLVLF